MLLGAHRGQAEQLPLVALAPRPPESGLNMFAKQPHFELSVDELYRLVRELNADLELRAVLKRAIALTLDTVGGDAGSLIVVDENGQVLSAAILQGGHLYDNTALQLKAMLERGLAGWVFRTGKAALVPDTADDKRWVPMLRGNHAADSRSAICVPLMAQDRRIGVFTVVHSQPRAFSRDHLVGMQLMADLISPVVMNALLYAQSRRQARLMQAWAESAMVIAETLEASKIIRRMLEQVGRALRTEAAALAFRDPHDDAWSITDAVGVLGERLMGSRLPAAPAAEDVPQCPALEALHALGAREISCALLPLEEGPAGALIAVNPVEGRFREDMVSLLEGIATLTATALRHARVFSALREAHEQYRALFNDTLDWIFITDLQGRVVEANKRAKEDLGYRWEALRAGTLPITAVHDLPTGILPDALGDIPASPPLAYESEVHTSGDAHIPVEVYVRRVSFRGRPHLQWILRDITERKRLDTLRDDLLAMLYHDLRAPLSSISMSLELLEPAVGEGAGDAQELITIARRSAARLERLSANMLDLSRLEAGQMPLKREAVQPQALITEALEVVAPHADQRHQTVRLELSPDLPPVSADREMIRRVLINLLENAVKYSPPGSHIRAGARREGGRVRFWVADNGPGIPKEEQERIFQKYDRGSTRRGKGLGLGLAFARLAVQAHGGTIGVESEPGQGALFCFTLPLAQDETPA